jgi:hypothetical protein
MILLPAGPTSFEEIVKGLKLSPEQYTDSAALKDWVRKNKDQKYVPLALLATWGFTVNVGY